MQGCLSSPSTHAQTSDTKEPHTGPTKGESSAHQGEPRGRSAQVMPKQDSSVADSSGQAGKTSAKSQQGKKKLDQTRNQVRAAPYDAQHVTAMPLTLQNRHNQCYINSVALLLLKAAACANSPLGSIQSALEELARYDYIDILRNPTWSRLLCGWRQPRQQHDVSELLAACE